MAKTNPENSHYQNSIKVCMFEFILDCIGMFVIAVVCLL